MNPIKTIRAKGPIGTLRRATYIARRFGRTPRKFELALDAYARLVESFGVGLTLPITAAVLARNPGAVRASVERGVEFAIHGLYHSDYRALDFEAQRKAIDRATAIFAAHRVPFVGFRAPYLRANEATQSALRLLGLLYDSSEAIAFDGALSTADRTKDVYRRALAFYGARNMATVARPSHRQGLIEIPVTVPDDEIMVDRLGFGPQQQEQTWSRILDMTYEREDLFTLQLHPERVFESGAPLRAILTRARASEPKVWVATMADIARWWLRRREASVSLKEDGGMSLSLAGDPRLRLRLLHAGKATRRQAIEEIAPGQVLLIRDQVRPTIGVTSSVSSQLRDFLVEEGFIVEDARPGQVHGAYLDIARGDWSERGVLERLWKAEGPLVRLMRWPEGARSALAVTGDVDALTIGDFALRYVEESRWFVRRQQAVHEAA
jgi:peptidoglycan/xylan/chitin deacetylase (PgdA/CDA1 family)